MGHDKNDKGKHDEEYGHHHILSNSTGLKILLGLLGLTIVTVITARIDLGMLNAPIAIAIACCKASLVVLYFMGLKYDSNENRVFFISSFAFFLIFVVLTMADVFTREGQWRTGPDFLKPVATGGPKFKKFWTHQDELKERGHQLFAENQRCTMCHGTEGKGNGPAAAALNPKPRDFTQDANWKNGRKLSQIVGTLTHGLGSMPQFTDLSLEDRFALAQYVQSLNSAQAGEDSPDELKKVGLTDLNSDNGVAGAGPQKRDIPIDFAMDRYLETNNKKSQ